MCPSKVLQKMLEMRENTEGGDGSARGVPRRGSWIRTEQHDLEMLHLLDSGPHGSRCRWNNKDLVWVELFVAGGI